MYSELAFLVHTILRDVRRWEDPFGYAGAAPPPDCDVFYKEPFVCSVADPLNVLVYSPDSCL